jgi:hypothetical protein
LELLYGLNPSKCLTAFRELTDLGIDHEAGFTRHSFEAIVGSPVVNKHMEKVLATVDLEMYLMVAPRKFLCGIDTNRPSNLLYADHYLMDVTGGLTVSQSQDCSIRFHLMSLSSVITAELTAISVALIHISFEITGDYVILTDTLTSIHVIKINQWLENP